MATGRVPTTANSPLTAKGDLFGYSTTQARVAVGSDGDTLVADSAATTGLRWSGGTGLVNPVINGAADIWQRGTSFAFSSAVGYSADRWYVYSIPASTISRQTTSDTTNLPNIQYCLRAQRNSGNTSTSTFEISTTLETVDSIPYAGKTVTLSFYARAGANFSAASSVLDFYLATGTGTDQRYSTDAGFTGLTAPKQTATLTTTWQRFTYTATLATNTSEIGIKFAYAPVGTAGAADYYEVTGVQLDVGQTALPFRRSGGTLQGELAACQRYFQRFNVDNTQRSLMNANWYSTTNFYGVLHLPVQMRTYPIFTASAGTIATIYYNGTNRGSTAIVLDTANDKAVTLNFTSSTGTAGNAGIVNFSTASSWIDLSAEL